MADISDLIGNAIDKNPVDFADTFNQLIQQKQLDAIQARRVELAKEVYGSPEDELDGAEDESEDSDEWPEDISDLEDLDIDDIDIDLDDIPDLEDITDDQEDA